MSELPRIAYSVEELAQAAGLGRTTLYAEIREGRLRPVKVGNRTLIPASEAQAWLSRLAGPQPQE